MNDILIFFDDKRNNVYLLLNFNVYNDNFYFNKYLDEIF